MDEELAIKTTPYKIKDRFITIGPHITNLESLILFSKLNHLKIVIFRLCAIVHNVFHLPKWMSLLRHHKSLAVVSLCSIHHKVPRALSHEIAEVS